VTGDYKADLVALVPGSNDSYTVYVFKADGSGLGTATEWANVVLPGLQTVLAGDKNGDGAADLVLLGRPAGKTGAAFYWLKSTRTSFSVLAPIVMK
jgi:hypothetical protein